MDERTIAGDARRSIQIRRNRSDGWSKAERKRFLDTLATTCNVSTAALAIGKATSTPYRLRRTDAAFAALWDEAMAIGYERLEAAVLRRALVGVNAIEIEGEEPELGAPADRAASDGSPAWRPGAAPNMIAPVQEVQAALAVLNRHTAFMQGRKAPHRLRGRATDEETLAALEKQLDALARRSRKRAE